MPRRDVVARARHRHGRRRPRAAGRVAEVGRRAACSASAAPATASANVSKGRIFPKFRADLLECAVVAQLHARGPDRADRRAAQRARRARPADRRDRRRGGRGRRRSRVDDLYALVTRTHSYAELPRDAARERARHARRPLPVGRSSASCARASSGTASPARSARARARASSRSRTPARSPTAACSPSSLPDGRRVGELDEEMVYEARPGQTFLLGASTWRIEEIGRDRVIVTPAPGVPGRRAVLEGRQRRAARRSSGEAIGAFAAGRSTSRRDARARLRPRRARRAQPARLPARAAGRRRASSRATARSSSSASATRSATGACACSRPYGGRVHAAWGLALSRADPRRVRPRVRRDLVRRRDHRPPPRRRRAAGRGPRAARARRGRGRGRRRARRRARCSARASARTPAARC